MDGWLPTTAYAILGLLSFGEEMTGYQLQRRSLVSLKHFFWSPAMSQIYSELRRLEELGLIAHRTGADEGPRPKRAYRITEAGQSELARWLSEGPHDPPSVLKNMTCLRTFYGHLIPPEQLRDKAEQHRRWSEERRQELEVTLKAVEQRTEQDPRWRYAAFVIEWGLDYYGTEARAAARLAERLDGLIAEEAGR